jgi:hypothetical protein
MGYGFIKHGKIDWSTWEFKPEITNHILFTHNALRSRHARNLERINYTAAVLRHSILLFQWLRSIWDQENSWWTFRRKFDAVSAVWLWVVEVLVWEFQKEVLSVLEKDGWDLGEFKDDTNDWIPNAISFDTTDMPKVLNYRMEFASNKGKSALERLRHLWGFNDDEKRDGWDEKKYRILYQTMVTNWNCYFGDHAEWQWEEVEFLKHFVRRCWVWPHNLTGKWWVKSRQTKERLWQGLCITSLWFAHPTRWYLYGRGPGKIGHPEPIDTQLIDLSGKDLIARISATAGSTECPGHLLVFQLDWQWKMAHVRRAMPLKTIRDFTGSVVLESQLLRTAQEQRFYNDTWKQSNITNYMISDLIQAFYMRRGYSRTQESSWERRQRYVEMFITDKHAGNIMRKVLSSEKLAQLLKDSKTFV